MLSLPATLPPPTEAPGVDAVSYNEESTTVDPVLPPLTIFIGRLMFGWVLPFAPPLPPAPPALILLLLGAAVTVEPFPLVVVAVVVVAAVMVVVAAVVAVAAVVVVAVGNIFTNVGSNAEGVEGPVLSPRCGVMHGRDPTSRVGTRACDCPAEGEKRSPPSSAAGGCSDSPSTMCAD